MDKRIKTICFASTNEGKKKCEYFCDTHEIVDFKISENKRFFRVTFIEKKKKRFK